MQHCFLFLCSIIQFVNSLRDAELYYIKLYYILDYINFLRLMF